MKVEARSRGARGALFFVVVLLLGLAPAGAAGGISAEQSKKATERSTNAARVLEAATGDKGIPKELLEKAQAVAVFPHFVKTKLLIEQLTISYGVVCARRPGGWSYPAYYTFGGAGLEFNVPGGESADVVMLFMNRESAEWFQKGRFQLGGEKRPVRGQVGVLSDEQRGRLVNADLIVYALVNGQLSGKEFESDFFNSFGLTPDNKLNKAVYGVKSSETLGGREPTTKSLPQGVTEFQSVLSKRAG